jgi:hypothetical protein
LAGEVWRLEERLRRLAEEGGQLFATCRIEANREALRKGGEHAEEFFRLVDKWYEEWRRHLPGPL